ncbi:hypothetical protein [Tardiphaga sp.]|uniref:hypothetical protein n=1 Tax=Tardiphaga sp. TaxID=1926292 RepID=UPI00262ED257|nr:hypothetical protein [Tardiphaga sp.]
MTSDTSGLRFEPLSDTPEAFEFSCRIKIEALGPRVRARWAWDDGYQREVHRPRLNEKPFFKIARDGCPIGTLSRTVEPDDIRLDRTALNCMFAPDGR